MEPLRLNDGVYFCETGDTFVVLDLPRDRYYALTPDQAVALRSALAHSVSNEEPCTMGIDIPQSTVLEPLFEGDLLVRSAARGRPLAATAARHPVTSLMDDITSTDGRITADRLWRFAAATRAAQRRLRRRPIGKTVADVRSLRPDAQSGADVDLEAARELTAAFHRLRPLYPAVRRCLFDSLALIEFLARYHVHPTWMFGVRLAPWTAHCWVQLDDVVLDDTLDHVVQLTPIMTV